MTSAIERLAMLHSHIKDNSQIKLQAEFPILIQSERLQYLNSNFQSVPGKTNSSYFASSVMRQSNKPVTSTYSPKTDNSVLQYSSQKDYTEIIASRSVSSMSKSFSNLEFDKICTNVDKKLRLLLGNSNPCDSYMLSGNESLGWDFLGSNIVNSLEDNILCIITGFYSRKFAEHLQKYLQSDDRSITILEAKTGHTVSSESIKNELMKKRYGIVALTHTDNSTGVVTNIKEVSQLVKQTSPGSLIVLDAIYSAGVEEIQVDNWEIDFTLCSYQNPTFTAEALSYILLSPRALLKTPEILINEANSSNNKTIQLTYSEENFQLLNELNASLKQLFEIDDQQDNSFNTLSTLQSKILSRFSDYKLTAEKLRKTLVDEEIGITTVSEDWANCSNGMTVLYVPKTVETSELLKKLSEECDICLVNETHPITSEYISIEHAGFKFSGNDINVDKVIQIIQKYLPQQ